VRRLIATADDFGLAIPVNEAVEAAHTHGILTAASLMVTGRAAADAVARARGLPDLGVGLHLVLVQGTPALPPVEIQALVGPDGLFPDDTLGLGVRLFFDHAVQAQAEAELRAQFERFRATGLTLDHVNGHHHFHEHPTLVRMVLRLAKEYGVRAMRLPVEHPIRSARAMREGLIRRCAEWLLTAARYTGMRGRLRRAGVAHNDHLFGRYESGRMTHERVARFLAHLPEGTTEIYCHPATRRWPGADCLPEDYLCVEEYLAFADPGFRSQLAAMGVTRCNFSALAAPVATLGGAAS
jgi:hopanoid biosynthesis associated protein HpnK